MTVLVAQEGDFRISSSPLQLSLPFDALGQHLMGTGVIMSLSILTTPPFMSERKGDMLSCLQFQDQCCFEDIKAKGMFRSNANSVQTSTGSTDTFRNDTAVGKHELKEFREKIIITNEENRLNIPKDKQGWSAVTYADVYDLRHLNQLPSTMVVEILHEDHGKHLSPPILFLLFLFLLFFEYAAAASF